MLNKLKFYFLYILKVVFHLKIYIALAFVSVVFGAVLVTGAQGMAASINQATKVSSLSGDLRFGAELALTYGDKASDQQRLTSEDQQYLNQLKAEGVIDEYEIRKRNGSFSSSQRLIKKLSEPDAANKTGLQILYTDIGIDPQTYPFKGEFRLRGDESLQSIDWGEDGILITEDIARSLDVNVGENVAIFDPGGYTSAEYEVAGVVVENLQNSGRRVYYTLEGIERLYPQVSETVYVNGINIEISELEDRLDQNTSFSSQSYFILPTDAAPDSGPSSNADKIISAAINGMALVGVLFAGVGIVNATSVLVNKLLTQVAILKTIGFSRWDILVLFSLMLLCVGLVGSIVGTGLGVAAVYYLIDLLLNIGGLLVAPQMSVSILLTSIAAMTSFTFVFGLLSLAEALFSSPADILAKQNGTSTQVGRKQKLLLYFIAWLLGGAISSLLIGDIVLGFGVFTGAVVVLKILQVVLNLFVKLILLVPIPVIDRQLKIAKLNLKNDSGRMVLPIIAILLGMVVTSLVFSFQSALQQDLQASLDSGEVTSAIVVGQGESYQQVVDELESISADYAIVKRVPVDVTYSDSFLEFMDREDVGYIDPEGERQIPPVRSLQIRNAANMGDEFDYNEKVAGPGVYTPSRLCCVTVGEEVVQDLSITVEIDDQSYGLPVKGGYNLADAQMNLVNTGSFGNFSLIMTEQDAIQLGINLGSGQIDYTYRISYSGEQVDAEFINRLSGVSEDVFSFDASELALQSNNSIVVLGQFFLSISSVALVAAIILIFNIASLAIEQRKFRLQMLRAVGYSRLRIAAINVYEFSYLVVLTIILAAVVTPLIIQLLSDEIPNLNMEFEVGIFVITAALMMLVVLGSIALLTFSTLEERLELSGR